jgi:hypothetical protein
VPGNADSKSKIQERAGMKGSGFDEAFSQLLREGSLVECELQRANKQRYTGYRYDFG